MGFLFLMVILFMSVTLWFLVQLIFLLLNTESSLFFITPLEEFRVLWGYVLISKLGNVFIFSKKVLFSVSIIIVPFEFLTDFGLIFEEIIFCMRNGDSLVSEVFSSDSNMMNFANGGSGCILSSSELSDSMQGRFSFFLFLPGFYY